MTDSIRPPNCAPNPAEPGGAMPPRRRGRMKIFLGSAPGVGKTHAMLQSAIRRRREGVNVAILCVETHGRPETERMVAQLETLSHEQAGSDGAMPRVNLTGILAARPQVVLVDDLAKRVLFDGKTIRRHALVAPLLDAGIDVDATLDVQSLESVNESMARLSGVRLRDTVPDDVVAMADEFEVIDQPPEVLIRRLRDGLIHVDDVLSRSMRRFFTRRNLSALSDMARRVAADRMDALVSGDDDVPAATHDHLLVCINDSPVWRRVLRTARRLAETQHVRWTILYAQTPRYEQLDEAARERLAHAMRLGERWGAEIVTLTTRGDVADEILDYAERRETTRILVGRSRSRHLSRFFGHTVDSKLLRKAKNIEVTVVIPEEAEEAEGAPRWRLPRREWPQGIFRAWLAATAAVAGALAVAQVLSAFMPLHNVLLIFLAGVVLVAIRVGLWPSIYASLLSFVVYNFFFTEPNYSLLVTHEEDIITIFFFLVMATLTGNLAAQVRLQVEEIRRSAKRIENLYDFSRRVAGSVSLDDTLWVVVTHVAGALRCRALVLLPGTDASLDIVSGFPPEDHLDPDDRAAAMRAWTEGRAAGWAEPDSEAGAWLFIPMRTASGLIGLLGVSFDDQRTQLSPEHRRLLDAVVDQAAVAIERTKLTVDIEEARILSETEQLRSALLSSVSHDLRTPLVSILGSATSLANLGDAIPTRDRAELAQTILEESERLNRFVQNLLDMTRLGYGALEPKRDWIDLRDVIGGAVRDMRRSLEDLKVELRFAADLPLMYVDPVLIGQVVMNLLDNAAKHAPLNSMVTVSAGRRGEDIAVSVVDGGPGIPPDDRRAVFDMFYRVAVRDSDARGTGLGLAICKGLVEAHGGEIAAGIGPDGRGTEMTFTLPLREVPPIFESQDAEA
jgi:two-component system sensor histidine kinase KdpD